jgi:hypothetical protein
MNLLLDSVILIDHFNGVDRATRYLVDRGDACAVSAVTRAEVFAGYAPPVPADVVALVASFAFVPIDAAIADLAAGLRRLSALKLPDAFQAATAMHLGLRLVTRNTKDFPKTKFAFVDVPYRV